MTPPTPLTRSQVIDRLREHAGQHGFVTMAVIDDDQPLFRSLLVHFDSLAAARKAAGLPGSRRESEWSKERVIEELRRLNESGVSMKFRDLAKAGQLALLQAIADHAGGLRRARQLAGIATPTPAPRVARSQRANTAPARIASRPARHKPYTADEVIQILQELDRTRPDITAAELYDHSAVSAMRRLFGSVDGAIAAAGIQHWPVRKQESWDRERVIRELRACTAQNIVTSRKLDTACRTYFGSVRAARAAAGVPLLLRAPWTQETLLAELRRRARRGDYGTDLKAAGRRLFGSIQNARRAAGVAEPNVWTRDRVIRELRELARTGQQTIPPSLRRSSMRIFGSVQAACAAARVRRPQRPLMATWSDAKLLDELRRRVTGGLNLSKVGELCRQRFGSVEAARRAAGLPVRADSLKAAWVHRRAKADERLAWRRWSRDVIKRKLRAWNQRRGRMPRDLALACKYRFGSLNKACVAAKVEMPR